MAARKDSRIKTHHREAIKTSMLIKRLQKHAVNECMSTTQIRAAEILLNKTLPNLKVSDDTLTIEGDLTTRTVNVGFKGGDESSGD